MRSLPKSSIKPYLPWRFIPRKPSGWEKLFQPRFNRRQLATHNLSVKMIVQVPPETYSVKFSLFTLIGLSVKYRTVPSNERETTSLFTFWIYRSLFSSITLLVCGYTPFFLRIDDSILKPLNFTASWSSPVWRMLSYTHATTSVSSIAPK